LGWGGGEPPRGGSISEYAIKGIIGLVGVEVPIIVIEGGGYVGVTVEVNEAVVLSPRIPAFWAIPILAVMAVGGQRDPPPVNFGLYDFRANMMGGEGVYRVEVQSEVPDRQVYEIPGGANLLGGDLRLIVCQVELAGEVIVGEE
jgi:hypothetical protein